MPETRASHLLKVYSELPAYIINQLFNLGQNFAIQMLMIIRSRGFLVIATFACVRVRNRVVNFSASTHIRNSLMIAGAQFRRTPRIRTYFWVPFLFLGRLWRGFVSFEKVANLIRNSWKTTRKRLKFYMSKVIEKFKLPNLICSEMLPNNNTNSNQSWVECVSLARRSSIFQDLLCLLPPADFAALSKSKLKIEALGKIAQSYLSFSILAVHIKECRINLGHIKRYGNQTHIYLNEKRVNDVSVHLGKGVWGVQ